MSQDVEKRMLELMAVIDQALILCNNEQDQLMLACAMQQRTTEIFDDIIGEDGRRKMYRNISL